MERWGLTPLQAGGVGGSAVPAEQVGEGARLEPGGVLAVPLLTGDSEMTAIGTVTEVLGDRVFGFGHSFNNEGHVDLPMGGGYISGVIANLQTSFKLGSLTKMTGTPDDRRRRRRRGADRRHPSHRAGGFHGHLRRRLSSRNYHFQRALHPKFTPMLAGMAFGAAVTGASELPQYNTLDYDLEIEFARGTEASRGQHRRERQRRRAVQRDRAPRAGGGARIRSSACWFERSAATSAFPPKRGRRRSSR